MDSIIECYTGFYLETGSAVVCGVVLTDGAKKWPALITKPEGDYLNGLLDLLIERVESWKGKLDDRRIHLRVHVHHKNGNFKKVLDKAIKAAKTAAGYQGEPRKHIIKHTLTRKDHHKPACYDRMEQLVKVLIEINDPTECVELTTCSDSRSGDQLAVYNICQGEWNRQVAAANTDGDAPTDTGNVPDEPVAATGN